MNARTEERVGGWDSRSFSRGHAGLRDLADEEFSGIVETGDGAWLCMLNGKVVGVFEGAMDDFADADGTAHVAPDPALPLLFAMEELGGTLEEQYYTKDTPISDADGTLTSGSFTGYIELSENVLSGDYYVCYYGGRSMPVAFVGSSERLMTGDEAFERADDEVGIYDVYSVDVEVTEIPGGDAGRATAGADDRSRGGATHGAAAGGNGDAGRDRSAREDRRGDDRSRGEDRRGDDRATEDQGGVDGRTGTGGGRDDNARADARGDTDRGAGSQTRRSESGTRRDDAGAGSQTRRSEGGAGSGTRRDDADREDRSSTADDVALGASGPPLDDDNPLGDLSEQLQAAERQEPSIGGPAPGAAGDDPGTDDAPDRSESDGAQDRSGTDDAPDRSGSGGAQDRAGGGDPLAGGPNGADADATGGRGREEDATRGEPTGRDGETAGDRSGRGTEGAGGSTDWASGNEASDPVAGGGTRDDAGDRPASDPAEPAGRDRTGGSDPDRRDRDRVEDDRSGRGGDRDPAYRGRNGGNGGRADDRTERREGSAHGTDRSRTDRTGRGGSDATGPDRSTVDSGRDAGQPGQPGNPGGRADPGGHSGGQGDRPREGQRREDGRRFEDEAAWREDRSVPSIMPEAEREKLVEELREGIREREAEIERLRERVSTLEGDHEDHEADHERLREEVEELTDDLGELRRTVLRLDEDIERIRAVGDGDAPERAQSGSAGTAAGGTSTADGPDLTPAQAMAGTKLLVRYGSQGKPTLKTAHDGGADRQAVNDNLRLDVHTDFPAEGATVDGRPFEEFLDSRMEREFVEWLVRDLPFEIRETGNDAALEDLYDAIPRIDRVEFAGRVTIEYLDDEERDPEHVDFDVVARDDREQPLVVANFDASGDPATQGMVVELNDRAGTVREAGPLNAAFLVTSSYFDGQARDTASEATSGSFLSRDSRKSFVNLSRKRGYHLCLVESRGGDFHVRVPEL